MTALVIWFFGALVSAFVGVALVIIGLDVWLTHRREVVRQSQGAAK